MRTRIRRTKVSDGAEEATRLHGEEEERFRIAAETLRRAAEEMAQKRIQAAPSGENEENENRRRLKDKTAAVSSALERMDEKDFFRQITRSIENSSAQVSRVATEPPYDLQANRAALIMHELHEGSLARRQEVAAELASSPLISDAIRNLTGVSRDKTYQAFSLLFLIAKAGELQPLMEAIEDHPSLEVRVAVIKLLALTAHPNVRSAFQLLVARKALPIEVRLAVKEAIDQITIQMPEARSSARKKLATR